VFGIAGAFNTNGDLVTLSPTTGAGSYAVRLTGLGGAQASNYRVAAAGNADGTLTIAQAALSVAAADATRVAGAPNPAFSATVAGLVAGDTLAALFGPAGIPLTTTATAASPAGRYEITTTVRLRNYVLSVQPGTLTVAALALPPQETVTVPDVGGGTFSGFASATGDGSRALASDFVVGTGNPATSPLSSDESLLSDVGLTRFGPVGQPFVVAFETGTARAIAIEGNDQLFENGLLRVSVFESALPEVAALDSETRRRASAGAAGLR
jgi:MBG domain (YGX type)